MPNVNLLSPLPIILLGQANTWTGVQTLNSPVFVTPALGTPASGVLTNCTGLPSAGLVDGSVTLAKMANLAQDAFIGRVTASTGVPETATITAAARTVLDDTTVGAMVDTLGGAAATGTGGLARATSPTFVTPTLGTPASGTLTNCTFPTLNQNTTGSAATLTTPRAINGVNFDGSAAITVTAAAGTLSGTTLNATVVASSLTSVGTLASPVLTTPDINGGTADALTSLGIRSTGTGAFDLIFANTENLTVGAKTLTLTVNNANRVLTISGDATVSGTNTGDQTITLTGEVTGSGTGSFAATVAANHGGTHAVGQGGTGATTLTGIVISAGTAAFTALALTASQSIRMNAAGTAYEGFTPGTGTVTSVTGTAPVASSGGATPAISITGAAGQVLAGSGPAFTATPTLGASGTLGSVTMGNATSGLITLQPVAGALGTVTLSLPAVTGTLVTGGGTASGTNTGDQTITLTGDVTGSGTGSFAATIAAAAVTLAKMANLAQDQFIGRTTASTGVPETATITAAARTVLDDITVAAMVDTLGGAVSTGTGGLARATSPTFVTPALGTPASGVMTNVTGLPTAGLVDDAVTLAKMAAGTAGNLITYDAAGNPAAVATGTAAQVLTSNGAGAAPTFQSAGAAGANTALSNLAAVAINLPLLPDAAAADDFGSATLPFKDIFLAGSSVTPGTNNFRITGASTSGTRVITLPDVTGTLLYSGGALGTPASGVMTNVTGLPTAGLVDGAVTYAKIQDVSATDRVLGRTTVGAGDIEEIATTGSGSVVRATSPTLVTPALGTPASGVMTNVTGLPTAGLVDAAVTLAKMADVATARFIGRTTAGTGVPEALTTAQATALLDAATATVKGLVPTPPNNTTTFLRGDATFAAPGGATKEVFAPVTFATQGLNNIGASPNALIDAANENALILFLVPSDYTSTTSIELICMGVATLTSMTISLYSNYGAVGEAYDVHSDSNTTLTLTTVASQLYALSISTLVDVAALAAGDYVGIRALYNATDPPTNIRVLGVRFKYS